jgi:hypothetical protein
MEKLLYIIEHGSAAGTDRSEKILTVAVTFRGMP